MSQILHVLNRGVDKRSIFIDDKDRFRFIHNLFEFNDEENTDNNWYFFQKQNFGGKSSDIERRYIRAARGEHRPRKMLVDIYAFCLMPNHYHLLLSPRREGAVPKFMKKLNMGYSKYFNERYERVGTLFQGRYKSVLIKNHAHFLHIPYYIHLNPLDLSYPEWREGELRDCRKSLKFLESYRWSSHLDYLGKGNFPSLTSRDFLLEIFGGEKGYESAIYDWLKDLDLELLRDVVLE